MGGSVSAGKCNDELIDHLVDAEFIRTSTVQRVFRAVDRGDYYTPDQRHNAYKDIAWRMGNLHLSAPCVYSVVMEALKLRSGLSFLNLGSGSGYLSTMAGLVLGSYGTNHGIEFYSDVVDYAYDRLDEFLKASKAVDEYDFCEPVFTVGNCLTVDSSTQQYDRVYCGAACPEEYEHYIKNFVKVNGILIMPLNDKLLKITRVDETTWLTVKVLSVSFAPLIAPPPTKDIVTHVKLGDITPPKLLLLCRSNIRNLLRNHVDSEHPKLKVNQLKHESRPRRQVRRIVIPFFDESDLSNSQSNSEYEYDSDNPDYTISSHLPSRMSSFLEDFLRRHAELQLLREMEEDQNSSSDCEGKSPKKETSTKKEGTRTETKEDDKSEDPSAPKSEDANTKNDDANKMDTAEQHSSDNELFSVITVSNIRPSTSSTRASNSSDESTFNQPPSQSTRSKKKRHLKRKRPSSSTSEKSPGTSASGTSEPKRKVKRTSATVVWKKMVNVKSEEKKVVPEEPSDYNYTRFMIEKIGALPLPSVLLRYLNYRRDNL